MRALGAQRRLRLHRRGTRPTAQRPSDPDSPFGSQLNTCPALSTTARAGSSAPAVIKLSNSARTASVGSGINPVAAPLSSTINLGSDAAPSSQALKSVVGRCISKKFALRAELTLQSLLGCGEADDWRRHALEMKPCQGEFRLVLELQFGSEAPNVVLVRGA